MPHPLKHSRPYQLVTVFCCQVKSGLALAIKHIDPRLMVEQGGHDTLVAVLCSVQQGRPPARRLHVDQLLDLGRGKENMMKAAECLKISAHKKRSVAKRKGEELRYYLVKKKKKIGILALTDTISVHRC